LPSLKLTVIFTPGGVRYLVHELLGANLAL
jgi:hypothetical protein